MQPRDELILKKIIRYCNDIDSILKQIDYQFVRY